MAPKSAKIAGHASQVLRRDISSSAAHPVRPMADMARPTEIVAQKSHWQPRQDWRRTTMVRMPTTGGTSRAAARNQLSDAGSPRSSQPAATYAAE